MTESEVRVLRYLSEEGPASKYDVKKDEEIPYSTVHTVFERLEEMCFIREEREEKTEKGGTKTVYNLTFPGILAVIDEMKSKKELGEIEKEVLPSPEDVSEIVERNGKLNPWVFEVISPLREQDESVARVILSRISRVSGDSRWVKMLQGEKTEEEVAKEFAKDFYTEMLWRREDSEEIAETISEAVNEKLLQFISNVVEDFYEDKHERIQNFKKAKDLLEPSG